MNEIQWENWELAIRWSHVCPRFCNGCGYDINGQCLATCPECRRELFCARFPLTFLGDCRD